MAGFYNPKVYRENRQKEERAHLEHERKYFDHITKSHIKGGISGQEFPGDERWMSADDRHHPELKKRGALKEHQQSHWKNK